MTHPHTIDYYDFPVIKKPVYRPDDNRSQPIVIIEEQDRDWWQDDDGEDE